MRSRNIGFMIVLAMNSAVFLHLQISFLQRSGKLWLVEYYIINYLFFVGDNEAAMTQLKKAIFRGIIKPALY